MTFSCNAVVVGRVVVLNEGAPKLAASTPLVALAGISVTRAGTAPSMPTLAEVNEVLNRHSESSRAAQVS